MSYINIELQNDDVRVSMSGSIEDMLKCFILYAYNLLEDENISKDMLVKLVNEANNVIERP